MLKTISWLLSDDVINYPTSSEIILLCENVRSTATLITRRSLYSILLYHLKSTIYSAVLVAPCHWPNATQIDSFNSTVSLGHFQFCCAWRSRTVIISDNFNLGALESWGSVAIASMPSLPPRPVAFRGGNGGACL